jgi:hypothetical protein
MIAAPFSAIMIVGAFVLVEVTAGITEASTFSAAHARRQYDAVDPANRLVASEYLGHLTA